MIVLYTHDIIGSSPADLEIVEGMKKVAMKEVGSNYPGKKAETPSQVSVDNNPRSAIPKRLEEITGNEIL